MGRMEKVWGLDAKTFNLERWLDPATGKLRKVSPFKAITFHAGPRTCLGRRLAMVEVKIMIATALSRFRLKVAPDQREVKYELSLTFPMKSPVHARVTEATGA